MKIDMHLHTRASFDCESDPAEIVCWAARKGIKALVVTEHDTAEGYDDLKAAADKAGIVVIPGLEHTAARGTHYLIYLTPELPLPSDDMEMIKEVHFRGGLVGIAHPFRSDTGIIYNQIENNLYSEDEVSNILSAADFIEVFNGKSTVKQNTQALELAAQYPKLIRIGGSDSHHPSTIGCAHTEIAGFKTGTVLEMAEGFCNLKTKVITLAELDESTSEKTIKRGAEGIRKLMVKLKPYIPARIWRIGKSAYRTEVNRIANKKAAKSITRQQ